jgi:hypothetical protein
MLRRRTFPAPEKPTPKIPTKSSARSGRLDEGESERDNKKGPTTGALFSGHTSDHTNNIHEERHAVEKCLWLLTKRAITKALEVIPALVCALRLSFVEPARCASACAASRKALPRSPRRWLLNNRRGFVRVIDRLSRFPARFRIIRGVVAFRALLPRSFFLCSLRL